MLNSASSLETVSDLLSRTTGSTWLVLLSPCILFYFDDNEVIYCYFSIASINNSHRLIADGTSGRSSSVLQLKLLLRKGARPNAFLASLN